MRVKLSVMQRSLLAGVAAAALVIVSFLLGAGQGSAEGGVAAGPGPAAAGAAGGRITVTGTGTVSGTPDQLLLSMGAQASGGSVAAALGQANRAVRAVTAALGRAGVRAADVQTSGLSVQPQYGNGSPLPTGYSAGESIQVTLRHLSAAGSQIAAAVRAGGNATVLNGVSLNLTDTGALLAAARARAVTDARVIATQEAHALGRSLGPVVSISGPSQPPPPDYPMAASGARASVPISPGSQKLSVTVTVVFALA